MGTPREWEWVEMKESVDLLLRNSADTSEGRRGSTKKQTEKEYDY